MRSSIVCLALVIVFVASGCSRQSQHELESRFMLELSPGDMIARMDVPQLQHSSASGGGSSSTPYGETSRRSRDFQLVYRIEETEGARFDEESFLRELNNEIVRAAAGADLDINGSGRHGDTYSFDYTQGEHEGWLTLIGARTDGGEYKVWCIARESTRHADSD